MHEPAVGSRIVSYSEIIVNQKRHLIHSMYLPVKYVCHVVFQEAALMCKSIICTEVEYAIFIFYFFVASSAHPGVGLARWVSSQVSPVFIQACLSRHFGLWAICLFVFLFCLRYWGWHSETCACQAGAYAVELYPLTFKKNFFSDYWTILPANHY